MYSSVHNPVHPDIPAVPAVSAAAARWYEFTRQWQQRQLFAQVAVTPTGCLGPCGMGPSVLVYPEGIMYGNVTVQDVSAIFEEHLLGGKPVERLIVPAVIW